MLFDSVPPAMEHSARNIFDKVFHFFELLTKLGTVQKPCHYGKSRLGFIISF